jgi:predicted outer membrane repeat protein
MIRGQSNTLPSSAYGSYITYYNQPMTIDNTLFEDNYASSGRGAAINTQNDTTITNSTFIYNRQNSYSNYGGAIFSEDGLLDIDSCIFINNSARYSVSSYSGSVTANEGTAIYNAKGDMNIRNSLIISNVTAVSAIYNAASDGEVIANYNYWGNATPEGFYKSTSSGSDITVDNWVILNVTVDPEENINYKD